MQSLGNPFQVQLLGDHAILIKLSKGLNGGIDQDLLALAQYLKAQKIPGLKDVILAYDNLTLVYDAGFQKGAMTDGLMFILPIRRSISPSLYVENDKIRVELWSISEDEFNFYSQARLELNNAGLFSRPAANIPTNIKNTNPASKLQGTGWFGVSAVSSLETVVDPKKAKTGLK